MIKIPVTIIRGGTSKGIYIMRKDLPEDETLMKKIILGIFGSPDVRQIDGLGGADIVTSKVAIIDKSDKEEIDVYYKFGQVGIKEPVVDFSLSCGNLVSGVGVFALLKGFKKAEEPFTMVNVYDVNIRKHVRIKVPVKDGMPYYDGDFYIDGVPFPGARIDVTFLNPAGSITGKLLPTGKVRDVLSNGIEYSLVDAGVLGMFVKASDLGLTGKEGPGDIDNNIGLLNLINDMRGEVLVNIGMAPDKKTALARYQYLPKFIVVAPPSDFISPINGKRVKKEECSLLARVITGNKLHKAFPVTSSISLAAAFGLEGSIVNEVAVSREEGKVFIGHPSGVIDLSFKKSSDGEIEEVTIGRTARLIMEGIVYVPESRIYGRWYDSSEDKLADVEI
ncbi:MAG: 3-methylitaconate isomerase [Synergistetes bacterium]|nr:3-methylitaconate isomerase [Synergistota bacterium]MCX8128427.1 3-methylitaconate isomerase [Synergistota bacterium]MDW8192579.1 PrpF domain-containing protein [Synergistota bacterium]